MGRIFPLLSQYMCNFDREQTGRHLHRLFAISRQHLCVWWVLLIHSTFCRDLARLWLFSSGSNLEQECPVGTVIICILTPGWVCYVRSPRPKIISTAISMKFEEFLLCFFFLFCFGVFLLLVLWSWPEVSDASRSEYMQYFISQNHFQVSSIYFVRFIPSRFVTFFNSSWITSHASMLSSWRMTNMYHLMHMHELQLCIYLEYTVFK